jgi:hypothetical protein
MAQETMGAEVAAPAAAVPARSRRPFIIGGVVLVLAAAGVG